MESDLPLVKATLVEEIPITQVAPQVVNVPTVTSPLVGEAEIEGDGPLLGLGRYPTVVTCPYCTYTGETRIERHNTAYTAVAVIIIAICFWPLFWLPFCITTLKKTLHFCTRCHRKVGTAKPCTT